MNQADKHQPDRADSKTSNDALEKENRGYNQRGHGKGGKAGEGEPDAHREDDGSTQPNFGQAGTYGKDPR